MARLGAGRLSWGEGFTDPSDLEPGVGDTEKDDSRSYHVRWEDNPNTNIIIRFETKETTAKTTKEDLE